MKEEHKKIIDLITSYLEMNPSQRFGQAIFNLKINEFENDINPGAANYTLRDIHGDNDQQIIERIENQLKWIDSQKNTL